MRSRARATAGLGGESFSMPVPPRQLDEAAASGQVVRDNAPRLSCAPKRPLPETMMPCHGAARQPWPCASASTISYAAAATAAPAAAPDRAWTTVKRPSSAIQCRRKGCGARGRFPPDSQERNVRRQRPRALHGHGEQSAHRSHDRMSGDAASQIG